MRTTYPLIFVLFFSFHSIAQQRFNVKISAVRFSAINVQQETREDLYWRLDMVTENVGRTIENITFFEDNESSNENIPVADLDVATAPPLDASGNPVACAEVSGDAATGLLYDGSRVCQDTFTLLLSGFEKDGQHTCLVQTEDVLGDTERDNKILLDYRIDIDVNSLPEGTSEFWLIGQPGDNSVPNTSNIPSTINNNTGSGFGFSPDSAFWDVRVKVEKTAVVEETIVASVSSTFVCSGSDAFIEIGPSPIDTNDRFYVYRDRALDTNNIVARTGVDSNGRISINSIARSASYFVTKDLGGGCQSRPVSAGLILVSSVDVPIVPLLQAFCGGGMVSDLEGNNVDGWYSTAVGGVALASTAVLSDGDYYVENVEGSCSSSRIKVEVNIIELPSNPEGDSLQVFCIGSNATVDSLVSSNVAVWYDAPIGGVAVPGTALLVDGGIYYSENRVEEDGKECVSALRDTVRVSLSSPQSPVGDIVQRFCMGSGATIDSLEVRDAEVWYDSVEGGSVLANTTVLVDGDVYYAENVEGSCSSSRFGVQVELEQPEAPIVPLLQAFCGGGMVSDLEGNNVDGWYSTAVGGVALASTAVLSDGDYYAENVEGSCSSSRIKVEVNIIELPDSPLARFENDSQQRYCQGALVSDLRTASDEEMTVVWYNAPEGGREYNENELLVSGVNYYAGSVIEQMGITCNSADRLEVEVSLISPQAPLVSTPTSACIGAEARIVTTVSEGTVRLYDVNDTIVEERVVEQVGVAVFEIPEFKKPAIYYVTHTLDNCESRRAPVFVDTLSSPLVNAGEDIITVERRPVQLNAIGGISYVWDPPLGLSSVNIPNPVAQPELGENIYIVTAIGANGCLARDTIRIQVKETFDLNISGVSFSPNGDGINDNLVFPGLLDAYPNATVSIYNRWGDVVWESDGPYLNDFEGLARFNGFLTGEELSNGTYFYMIEFNVDPNQRQVNEPDIYTGFLELRR